MTLHPSGYAADGYARIKGIGAVVTAFGVGELSAINAIAGAEAEKAPVVHIVGTPLTSTQRSRSCLHHSLGNGDFDVFAQMYEKVTVAQANLTDPVTAPETIDAVLRTCVLQSRPVYVRLPIDTVRAKVDGSRLNLPIDLSPPPNDEGFEDAEVETILNAIYQAKNPAVVVDGFVRAYDIREEVEKLVNTLKFPTFTTPFGKSLVREDIANFHGIYDGLLASSELKEHVKTIDLALRFGPLKSDVNTCGFTSVFPEAKCIDFYQDSVHFSSSTPLPPPSTTSSRMVESDTESTSDATSECYRNLHTKSLLHKLLDKLDLHRLPQPSPSNNAVLPNPSAALTTIPSLDPKTPLHHRDFWPRLSSLLLKPRDLIMTETGTASMGGRELVLPPHTTLINSSLWLSIGYMFAAAVGAALAQQEENLCRNTGGGGRGRTILLTGDGSLQMTAQELGTIIRHRIPLLMFLINNDGYTIERHIHGMNAAYNDVARWRYRLAPRFFGADDEDEEYPVRTYRAENWAELGRILEDETVQSGKGLQMVEVVMGREDAPESLIKLVGRVTKMKMDTDTETDDRAEVKEMDEVDVDVDVDVQTMAIARLAEVVGD